MKQLIFLAFLWPLLATPAHVEVLICPKLFTIRYDGVATSAPVKFRMQ